MCFYNKWIDLVQLISEAPKYDAYRRDLIINSLFYNLNTGLVEDGTGRGIDDLKNGRIVTPLSAEATFLEDPLRFLRAIRFAARYGFTLDEEVKKVAASSEKVRVALAGNVSRERIGNEIDLMISGNRPVSALTYISDLKLFSIVFALPSEPEDCGGRALAYMEAMWNLIQTHGLVNLSGEQTRLALYAALFLPYRNKVYKDNNSNGKLVPVVKYIFKVSIKRKSSDAEAVINIHRATERFLSLIPPLQLMNDDVQLDKLDWNVLEQWEFISHNDPEVSATSKIRVATGFLLRDIKDLWRVSLLTSLLLLLTDDNELDKKRDIYLTIQDRINELCLDDIWDAKPMVSGSDIIKALNLKNRGHIIREWQQKLLTWQLAYPRGMSLRQQTKPM